MITPFTINGEVKRIIHHNAENGFSVASLLFEGTDDNGPCPDCVDFSKLFTATFCMVGLRIGIHLKLTGVEKTTKYGRQLDCSHVQEILPTNALGIELFLGSGIIPNLGKTTAHNIVEKFGEKTLELLDKADERLFEVKGVGKSRMKAIVSEWGKYKAIKDTYMYLEGLGISPKIVSKIYGIYGEDTVSEVRANPYKLIEDVRGIGFITADQIALKLGYEPDGSARIQAAIIHILDDAGNDGHCFLPTANLINGVSQLIQIPPERVEIELAALDGSRRVVCEDDRYYHRRYHYAEVNVARRLLRLYNTSFMSEQHPVSDEDIELLEKKAGMSYGDKQKEAIRTAMQYNVMLLTGGPGTGKTTVLKAIIDLFKQHKYDIIACAPTGKAAERMSEATGMEAMTIHRTLGYTKDGSFDHNFENPLNAEVVIVDESSMIDITLMSHLLNAINFTARLILVGDVDQLPCIGPGNILHDIINAGTIPVVCLDCIFRQSHDSSIIVNAHRINNGEAPLINNKGSRDFFFIPETDPYQIQNTIVDLIKTRLPKTYGLKMDDIQILTPMKRGPLGTEWLNNLIQEHTNRNVESIKYLAVEYKKDDRVVQIVNNYDKGVFNGDTGIIMGFCTDSATKERAAMVRFKGGRIIKYTTSEFKELILAYALTIHKSQGSEFPAIIIPITSQHHVMLERNLLYTGVTRAKKLCILIGSLSEIQYAAKNFVVRNRYTWLANRLRHS